MGSHFAVVKHAEQCLILIQTKALLSMSEGCSVVSSLHAHSLGVSGSSVVCTETLSLTHQGSSSCSLVLRNATKAARQQEPMLGGWTRKLELQHLDLGQKHQGEKGNPPNELLRPYVAVTSRMFVFHLLLGTAHPATVSHLKAVLGISFRTDSEEMVPFNGGTHSMVNHCVTSPSLGVIPGDLRAHSAAFLSKGWMDGRAGAVGWQHKEHGHCRQGALWACLLPQACTSKPIHICLTLHFWGIIPLI